MPRKLIILMFPIFMMASCHRPDTSGNVPEPSFAPLTLGNLEEIALYEGIAPGSEDWSVKETVLGDDGDKIILNTTRPTLKVYLPQKPTGESMIILPGGGEEFLSYSSEGEKVAERLIKEGITCFVLKYRTRPMTDILGGGISNRLVLMATYMIHANQYKSKAREDGLTRDYTIDMVRYVPTIDLSFHDTDQAIRLVRSMAKRWGLKKDHIGMMGFSAGAINTLNQSQSTDSEAVPDFLGIIYGGWDETYKTPKEKVPLFMVSPTNDVFKPQESLNVYLRTQEAGHPAELHYFNFADHGFGAVPTGKNVDAWMDLMTGFMRDSGFLTTNQ